MTAKELKEFLEGVDDDANVIMQDVDYKLREIRIRTEDIITEKKTSGSIHTYERKKIVVIY